MTDAITWREEWRDIPGLEFYQASNLGRVRSIDRIVPFRSRCGKMTVRRHNGKILSLKLTDGYFSFCGSGRMFRVNRVVCSSFHGLPPSTKHEAAHLNGNSSDNKSNNLVWATPMENSAHKQIHGTAGKGEKHPRCRLMDSDISSIREMVEHGVKHVQVAHKYGVHPEYIGKLVRKERRQVPFERSM